MNIPKSGLDGAGKVMLVGLGGGYDVFTGLPFVYGLPGVEFVLVNSGGKSDFHYRESTPADHPEFLIFPQHNIVAKYTVGRHGAGVLWKAYREIAEKHGVDYILAVDGGVDSLMLGDEQHSGTILEDFTALAALSHFYREDSEYPLHGVLCCAGFGTETEESLNHYRVLENIALHARSTSFLGSFSLLKNSTEFKNYARVCEYAWSEGRRKSHIQTKIISAVNGGFGENAYRGVDPRLAGVSPGEDFVSPLSSIYWMFGLGAVITRNKFVHRLVTGNTFADSQIILRQCQKDLILRDKKPIPL